MSTSPEVMTEDLAPAQLVTRCRAALGEGARMQFMYAWFPEGSTAPELRYVLHPGRGRPPHIWRCPPGEEPPPSLAMHPCCRGTSGRRPICAVWSFGTSPCRSR
jgi:hypothetical protein